VATWAPNATDQFRLSLQRDVSQLDFADFATGLDSISNTANVGNPNLEPEQSWKANLQWKRPIGERGSISVTAFYDDIEDTQDFIASQLTTPAACVLVTPTPAACIRTAIGNVGDGKRWGGRVEASVPLDFSGRRRERHSQAECRRAGQRSDRSDHGREATDFMPSRNTTGRSISGRTCRR
jgi:outer membrane receptor protein involved in Fe transport